MGIASRRDIAKPEALQPIVVHHAEHVLAVWRNRRPCCLARVRYLCDREFLKRRSGRTVQDRVNAETCRAEQGQHCEHSCHYSPFVLLCGGDEGGATGLRRRGRGLYGCWHACWCGCGLAARLGIPLQPLQVRTNFTGMLVTQSALFLQTFADGAFQFGRHLRVDSYWRNRSAAQNGLEDDAVLSPRNGRVPVVIS